MKKHKGILFISLLCVGIVLAFICSRFVNQHQPEKTAKELTFSQESGVYEEAFSLELLTRDGETVYYTLDGSDPTDPENDARTKYTSPISVTDRKGDANVLSAIDPLLFDSANLVLNKKEQKLYSKVKAPADDAVDKATVVRAVSQDKAGNYSAIQTHTYFVGKMTDHISGIKESCNASGMDLAIMSITVNPEDFFDPEKGIYVRGNVFERSWEEFLKNGELDGHNVIDEIRKLDANYSQRGKDWERQAHIDYFESNGDETICALQQDCGIRIQGNFSRSDLQKGMRLVARADYGKKNFEYPFFGDMAKSDDGNTISKFKKLVLRNGGNTAFTTKCSDAFWQSLIRDLDCETQASRVCVAYLNGEYWGLYVLQEDYSDSYFEQTHKVRKEDVVVYKGDAENYEIGYKLDEGNLPQDVSDESYYLQDLLKFFETHSNLKKQEDYDAFAKLVDVESVRDYFLVNIWINNKWDWPGKNWTIWKTVQTDAENPYADGRWRFCFYDLDFGGVSGISDADTNTILEDNYKEKGLLDMDTDNPVVLMYAYLMTNESFRKEFSERLQELSNK
nr:CotH kinase family protein [Lachnospiraceae bacterium]